MKSDIPAVTHDCTHNIIRKRRSNQNSEDLISIIVKYLNLNWSTSHAEWPCSLHWQLTFHHSCTSDLLVFRLYLPLMMITRLFAVKTKTDFFFFLLRYILTKFLFKLLRLSVSSTPTFIFTSFYSDSFTFVKMELCNPGVLEFRNSAHNCVFSMAIFFRT